MSRLSLKRQPDVSFAGPCWKTRPAGRNTLPSCETYSRIFGVLASAANISASVVKRIVSRFSWSLNSPLFHQFTGRITAALPCDWAACGASTVSSSGEVPGRNVYTVLFGPADETTIRLPDLSKARFTGSSGLSRSTVESFLLVPRVDALVVMVDEIELAGRVHRRA